MKILNLFFGLFFLISIVGSQSADAANPVPVGLQAAIEHVKKMQLSGASRKDIADYVTRTVINRLTFLNHFSNRISSDPNLEKKLKFFNAWRDRGDMVDDAFSAATWAWTNKMGQCNESAFTAFHILAMAYGSTDEFTIVRKGDHNFIVWGDVKNMPGSFSPDDLRNLDNSYIVDPWGGKSFSTKELSFFDLYQHGNGVQVARSQYKFYKRKYDKWLTWCKKNPAEYQKWLHDLSDADAEAAVEEKIEHEDSMNFKLDQHREEINALKALKKQILQKGKADLKKIKSNIWDAGYIQFELERYENLILALVDQGESYCDEARLLYQKIIALSAAMEDGEVLVNAKINLAKDRKPNCKTDADDVFIKNNYQAAQDAFAIMKKTKEAAFDSLVDINIKLEQIKKIDTELSQSDSDWWKEQRGKHEEFLEEIPQYLDQLETGLKDAKGFPAKVQDLKKKIEASKKYYTPYFPGAEADFDQLISEVSSIRLYYVIDRAGLDDLYREYHTAQNALNTPTGNNPRLFQGAPPLINCFSDTASKKVMDKIDEAFLRGLLVLKTNDYLRDGCKVKAEVKDPAKDNDNSPPQPTYVDTGGSTPGTSDPDSDDKNSQATSSNSMGGLIIRGPAELVAGQGVTYTACDGTGVPYTSGSFSWGHTNETILSLGKSGNPVSGAGFKAGNVTIFVHYDGGDVYSGTAYLDVKIKEKENNLFSTSGGEDSEDEQKNLFSSAAGDQTGTETSLFSSAGGGGNKLKNQCNQLLNNISSELGIGNTVSAQSLTYQAAALGCEIDSAILAQVENIEKNKKRQREQQLADIAREEERQKEECQKIRQDIISAINQKDVGTWRYLTGIAANKNCNENTSGIRVKEVQQGHSKPTRTTSTPSSGSKYNGTYGSKSVSSSKKPLYLGSWNVTRTISVQVFDKRGESEKRVRDGEVRQLGWVIAKSGNKALLRGQGIRTMTTAYTTGRSISFNKTYTNHWHGDREDKVTVKIQVSGNRLTGKAIARVSSKKNKLLYINTHTYSGTKK